MIRCILLWYISLLLSYSLPTPGITAQTNASETDRLALLAIKSQLHDPFQVTSSWNSSVSLCRWTGVRCGRRHQRVTVLDLRYQNIGGPLSPYIGNLSFLRSIDIRGNNFYGQIPHEVGRLFRLEVLVLANNSFSGTIPTNLCYCSNLAMLVAEINNLVGEIPAEIGYLSKLEFFYMGDNHLTGALPASIGNISNLQVIYLKGNSFSGRLPDTLGQLKSLIFINVLENKFSGLVPPSIYNISSLETITFLSNRFNGSLPHDIGLTLPNLKRFSVHTNDFTGPIPDSFTNASNLEHLDLAENHFSGKVSIDFSGLKNLSVLNLGRNNLGTGATNDLEFVTSLINCTKLDTLALYDNQFGGVLPQSIANLSTTMIVLAFGSNQISGTIPPGVANLFKLNAVALEFNKLAGTIPHEIGEIKNLQAIYLQGNNLRGSIPTSLGNLTILSTLQLQSNNLQGNIPSFLGNCQNLMMFDVSQNKLTGTVPPQILSITTISLFLGLSDNLLNGSFPLEVGNLVNLVALDMSKNRFSGQIPVTLGVCTSLEHLKMQGNFFNGSIPLSLNSLKSIKELDLSQNNLTGQIPQYLENLSLLESLNLSYNHFDGEVPTKGIFSNSTGISLMGNEKLCGGIEELHFPLCHSKASNKHKITLLKEIIPVIALCLMLSGCFVVFNTRRKKSAHKSSNMLHLEEQFPMISYADLSKATNDFSSSNIIGKGSSGFVYKGILGENGMLVAVKVLNLKQRGASKSFVAECEALRNIRHRNLIKIITICSSIDFKGADFKALVYEYMQNGSLEEWLRQSNDQRDACNLSLSQKLNIAVDVASAMEYLHHHCKPAIIHGDLKPSNVLLDHDLVAHLGDFGLAKFLSDCALGTSPETQSSSIGIKGTVGYVAPEYGMGGEVSKPGDVYSFGILLLEMFTRRRPTEDMFNDGLTLHGFAKMALPERVMEIVEPSLLRVVRTNNFASHGDAKVRIEECLVSVVRIGVLCSMETPSDRMEMPDVVAKLCAVRKNFLGGMI